jgi:hypothetical protein
MRAAVVLALCSVKSKLPAFAWSARHMQLWARTSPMITFNNFIELPQEY